MSNTEENWEKENKLKLTAHTLLHYHLIGDLRSEADLENMKFHSQRSIEFCTFILNQDKTHKEKIDFLSELNLSIQKFKTK